MISTSLRRLLLNSRKCFNYVEFSLYNGLQCIAGYQECSYISRSTIRTKFSRYFCTKYVHLDDADNDLVYDGGFPVFRKNTKKEAIEMFVNCLGCSESEAVTILKEFPKLKNLSPKDVENKLDFYGNIGIELQEIIKYPWILWYKISAVESKLKATKAMKLTDIKSTIPLLGVPLKRLQELQSWSETGTSSTGVSRIEEISEKLKCNPADIVYVLSTHKFVERLPYERLTAILDILLECGVNPDNILKDIWVVRYSIEQISNRIRRAKEAGILSFKTWMVRCPEKTFEITLRRQLDKQRLLGPHEYSAIQYISSRLGVSKGEAQHILTRHPQLRGVGAAKLCNTLDFLLGKERSLDDLNALEKNLNGSELCNAKFDRVQVWNSIRALCHSLETMKERLIRLRELGYEPQSPFILYKSRKKFEEFVKKLEERGVQNQTETATSGTDSSNKKVDSPTP